MFRKSFVMAALATLVVASYGMAATGTVVGGKHDFSAVAGGWAQGEICKPCHTPHHAQATDVSSRLWNHALTSATYVLREGATGFNFDGTATGAPKTELDGASYLCMSCHDGSVALDAFGQNVTSGSVYIGAAGNLGLDRRMDHPVGIEAVYGSRNKPPVQSVSATSGNKSYKVPVGTTSMGLIKVADAASTITAVDSAGATVTEAGYKLVVGCRTCHNVHSSTPKMLNTLTNSASQMCLGCHIK